MSFLGIAVGCFFIPARLFHAAIALFLLMPKSGREIAALHFPHPTENQ
jgi:hypothetical protein